MLSQNNLLILGAGQYGVMAKEIAEAMGVFGRIAFLDDSFNTLDGTDIIGTTADLPKFAEQFKFGFVAIGNPALRRKLTEQLQQNSFTQATLVHPTAYVSPSAQLEAGCCVEPNATVQTGAVIKQASFIASGAVIRHNATVGEFCHVDCNAVVNTLAVVPAGTHILAQETYRA
ncbi:conserved domain protein [Fibrobacter succinogenes subsp. succinogenes S85]|uniref:Conserved domain protein n=1 Tax=Fibrobacter succinogenes (strain ATCC 19169 / S85) TaxID=59374 RepID=C9RN18_FIBSS|nr:hypothetical protein [Fibrobacter succinogenes]ACX76270.1 PglB [Fibrobacter succinogenes subsp. succinogenes S85]ADL26989.1 conserved domain protein [Fibrobacter succinogenes subsp. succinogenes S85]